MRACVHMCVRSAQDWRDGEITTQQRKAPWLRFVVNDGQWPISISFVEVCVGGGGGGAGKGGVPRLLIQPRSRRAHVLDPAVGGRGALANAVSNGSGAIPEERPWEPLVRPDR